MSWSIAIRLECLSKIIIKVKAENGDIKEYIIRIEKELNIMPIIITVIVLIVLGIVSFILYKYRAKLIPIFFEKKEDDKKESKDTEEKKEIYDQDLDKTIEYKPASEEILTFEED